MKILKKILVITLTFVIAFTSVVSANTLNVFANEDVYTNDFSNPDLTGWEKDMGAGVFEVINEKLKIETDNWVAGSVDFQQYYNTKAPKHKNAILTMDINNNSVAGRFAVVYRRVDSQNYNFVGYDVGGRWIHTSVIAGKEKQTVLPVNLNVDNKEFKYHIEYVNDTLLVKVDNTIIYQGVSVDGAEGYFGFRTWGYTGNYASIEVDNIRYEKIRDNENDGMGNYMVSFKDSDHVGGWTKDAGNGSLIFADESMKLEASGNTLFSDGYAPTLKNGFVEFEFTPRTSARMGFLFRYNSASDFAGFGYDGNGNWNYITGDDKYGSTGTKQLTVGKKHHIRIEFIDSLYKLIVDENEVFSGNIDAMPTTGGKAGARVWGYDTGDTQGKMDIHNFKMGEFLAVNLTPSKLVVRNGEAGLYDITTTMSESSSKFVKLIHNEKELVLDSDYTISADGLSVTFKKDFIKTLETPEDSISEVQFIFDDGYITEFTFSMLGVPNISEELYVKDFSKGIDGITKVKGSGTLSHNNGLDIDMGNDLILIDENAPIYKNSEVEFSFDPKTDSGNFGIVVRYNGPNDYVMIGQQGQGANSTTWNLTTGSGQNTELVKDGNRIYAKRVKPYKVKVRIVEDVVTVFLDNAEIYTGEVKGISSKSGKIGLRYYGNAGANVSYLSVREAQFARRVTEKAVIEEINSETLGVKVDKNFPRIESYILGGQTIYGQETPIHQVEINNTLYNPNVTSTLDDNKITYHMVIEELNVSFDAIFKVVKNTVEFNIDNIKDSETKVYTINFPQHSLVSMRSNEKNAKLVVNNYSKEESSYLKDLSGKNTYSETTLTVLSSDNIAASVSNGSIKRRNEIAYQTFIQDGYTSTGIWTNEYLYRGLDDQVIENPWAKVAITLDRNADGKVDSTDGAIAYRDDIMKPVFGSEAVMQSYNSIAMNVGSNAQFPFLRILDNIKKFNLGTDGFGQNVVIKGYQSEGHDASHPDFNNFSDRAGGLDDMLVLLENAKDNNAKIGVHINHTEAYPEAPQYNDVVSSVGGWSWYDSSKQIIRENDILNPTQGMRERLMDLDQSTKGLLEMIYVDVYFDTRWPAYKILDAINSDLEMAVGTEYIDEFTSSSIWAHHIGSGFNNQGNLVRVIHNQNKDIFGHSKLFRDATTRNVGINGWQGSVDYNKSIKEFFTQVLPNKYLAQFPIMNYDSDSEVTLGKKLNVISKNVDGKNIMTQDGNLVAEGNKIFIPWTIDGVEKIYAWNDTLETKSWNLPFSWEGQTEVKLFKLSDQGRTFVETVKVTDGKVTLKLDQNTGYTLYKGDDNQANISSEEVDWTIGSLAKDSGFNSHKFGVWKTNNDQAQFRNNSLGNTHMIIEGPKETSVSQMMANFKVGESYGASVWAKVENGKKAILRITDGDNVYENYIDKSDVLYGVHHSDKRNTTTQRMGVTFIAENENILIELIGAESNMTGKVDFDDVRVRTIGITDQGNNTFYEDFENVDEGFGPFVSTNSDNSHLAETHLPFTNDTIKGRYSLKVRYGDHMRTLPQTMRLKPNTEYKLSFEYLSTVEGVFNASIKSDDANQTLVSKKALNSDNKPAEMMLEFTTGAFNDYYLDISASNARSGNYSIDELILNEVKVLDTSQIMALIKEYKELDLTGYTEESVKTLLETIKLAEALLSASPTQSQVEEMIILLSTAYKGLEKEVEIPVVDINELEELIKEYKLVDLEGYTEETIKILAETIQAAELLLTTTPTQTQVDEMIVALHAAYKGLEKEVEVPVVDTSAIDALIKEYKELNTSNYTQESVKVLTDTIQLAEKLLTTKPTQAQVNEMVVLLQDAYQGLVKEEGKFVDTSLLEELLEESKAFDLKGYTDESINYLVITISRTEKFLESISNSTTQEEVDLVLQALKDAISNLVLIKDPVDPNIPLIPLEPSTPVLPTEPETPTLPGTGVSQDNTVYIVGGLVIVAGIVLVLAKRRKDKDDK